MIPQIDIDPESRYARATWTLGSGETGAPLALRASGAIYATVMVTGNFATGSVTFEGSMDGVTWAAVKLGVGTTAMAFINNDMQLMLHRPRFVRPVASVAVGLDVTVTLGNLSA